MKQVFLVLCWFEMSVKDNSYSDHSRYLMVCSEEGKFDSYTDALERVRQMTDEESKNKDQNYFEIKAVFTNK